MKLFQCQSCNQLVYFENTHCVRCGMALGFLTEIATLSALAADANGMWQPLALPGRSYRSCANASHGVCNWLVPADSPDPLCQACALNRTIPDLTIATNLEHWRRIELAKHRVVYAALRLGLPVTPQRDEGDGGLAFDFIADTSLAFPDAEPVRTGHDNGLVTLNIVEADDAERERQRQQMAEPYRTLIGHLRHEIGHYYEQILVVGPERMQRCRELFGDERMDYAEALERHYRQGPPPDWQARHVSAYASSHPWEDFAESWAHYLLIIDALETASAFGLRIDPAVGDDPALSTTIDVDPYRPQPLPALIDAWLPLTYAANALNRSVGQADFYPFVLNHEVVAKLDFVHGLVHGQALT
ncbi:MAG: putative zinc-binding peptidase [Alphaproteobacteria bacterium]